MLFSFPSHPSSPIIQSHQLKTDEITLLQFVSPYATTATISVESIATTSSEPSFEPKIIMSLIKLSSFDFIAENISDITIAGPNR